MQRVTEEYPSAKVYTRGSWNSIWTKWVQIVDQPLVIEKTIAAGASVTINGTEYSLYFVIGTNDNVSCLVATAYRTVKVLDASATEGVLTFVESESTLTITNNKATTVNLKIYKIR